MPPRAQSPAKTAPDDTTRVLRPRLATVPPPLKKPAKSKANPGPKRPPALTKKRPRPRIIKSAETIDDSTPAPLESEEGSSSLSPPPPDQVPDNPCLPGVLANSLGRRNPTPPPIEFLRTSLRPQNTSHAHQSIPRADELIGPAAAQRRTPHSGRASGRPDNLPESQHGGLNASTSNHSNELAVIITPSHNHGVDRHVVRSNGSSPDFGEVSPLHDSPPIFGELRMQRPPPRATAPSYRKHRSPSEHSGISEEASLSEEIEPSAIIDSDKPNEDRPPWARNVARAPLDVDSQQAGDFVDIPLGSVQYGPAPLVTLVSSRMPEIPRSIHDTPPKKVIPRGDHFYHQHRKGTVIGQRTPAPMIVGGRPWNNWEDKEVTNEEWARQEQPSPSPVSRRVEVVVEIPISPHRLKRGSDAMPSITENTVAVPDGSGITSQRSHQSINFTAPASKGHKALNSGEREDDTMQSQSTPLPDDGGLLSDDEPEQDGNDDEEDAIAEGKPREVQGKAGPSDLPGGRPKAADNEEIERVGHRMQMELVDLSKKLGLKYETLLKKIGFSHQEVREPTLSNVFRQVRKHRLLASGQPTETPAQYAIAFRKWSQEHGSNPESVQELFREQAEILAKAPRVAKPSDVPKRVASISQQMAGMANSYFMAHNIAVVGAVIHLGSAHAAQTFAPNVGQQVAIIKGFDIEDEQTLLLKAKCHLLLQAEKDRRAATSGTNVLTDRWTTGNNPRDSLRGWVKSYLNDALAAVQTPPVLKWDEKKWPKTAIALRLVLVGWGPSMPCLPNQDWIERRRGGLTQVHWQNLVNRIPESWHNNPYHKVSDVELALRFMPLDEFLLGSPQYEGRHPCIVNHVGRVLYFAEEDKGHLKATAPQKKTGKSPRKASNGKQRIPSSSSSEDSEASNDEETQHPTHFVPAGNATPSGNYTKRARVGKSVVRSVSPPNIREEPRPMKPIPPRAGVDGRKRKRSDTVNMQSPEQRWPHVTPVLQPSFLPQHGEPSFANHGHPDPFTMGGFLQPTNLPGATMFPQQFTPSPFASQPPYAQHGAFHGHGYPPPFYPAPYGHQNWHVPPAANAIPTWGGQPTPAANAIPTWGGQPPYGQEEVDATHQLRRGGFNHG